MAEYWVPAGRSETEYVEKRSRFLGQIVPVESEEEVRACLEAVRKKHYDARHHCWCFRLRGGVERCSDDGEPQGTAGQPMLNVFQREGIENVCCTVTRYFGGILLGAGGLVRAYGRTAKDALDLAGVSAVRRWVKLKTSCPYARFERVKRTAESFGGVLEESVYAADVQVFALLPEERVEEFTQAVTQLLAGNRALVVGEVWKAAPGSKR